MKKRWISLFLALTLLCSLMPVLEAPASAASYDAIAPNSNDGVSDYRQWAQGDSRWGNLRLGNTSDTVSLYGCTVTSVTKIIIQAGLKDPSSFNVATLVNWMNANGGFDENGWLRWDYPATYSGLTYTGGLCSWGYYSSADNNGQIIDWINQGYHIVLNVDDGGHWVAVDEAKTLSTGTVHIMDSKYNEPNADITLASRYPTFNIAQSYKGGSTPSEGTEKYLSECTYYPSYLTVKTPNASKLWNIPASDATTDEAVSTEKTNPGDTLTVTAMYKNTKNKYWYEVTYNGSTCYLYAGNTTSHKTSFKDVTIDGVVAPSNITVGKSFVIEGAITSKYTLIDTVVGIVKSGNKEVIYCTDKVDGRSYSLKSSQIDKKMTFNTLSVGNYNYELRAWAVNHYSDDGETLYTQTETVYLHNNDFKVVKEDQHTCDQSTFVYYESDHPHYSCYSCSVCGAVSRNTSQTNQLNTCDQCRPGKPVLNVSQGSNGSVSFTWADTANTTHYCVWLNKKNDDGNWSCIEQVFYAESGFQRTLDDGEYYAQLLSYSSDMWEPDGSDWVHTWANDVYFTVSDSGSDSGSDNSVYHGIDVSHHQGTINWDAVAPNIDFAIVRCGYGDDMTSQDDQQWKANADACTRLGIPFGVYIYSYALTDAQARSEANHVLRLIQGYSPDLPIYLDLEDQSILNSCSKADILRHAQIFCDIIEDAGYEVGIYANYNWWTNYLTDSAYDQWSRWIARYASETGYNKSYKMWQYTDKGSVPGINGAVDMNYWYGALPGSEAPYFQVSGVNFPDTFRQGSTPVLEGSVSSNDIITWIWTGVDTRGAWDHVIQADYNPLTTYYDLSSLIAQLDFASLAPGEYTYKIEGISGGQYFVAYEKDFTVTNDELYFEVSGVNFPSTIVQGTNPSFTGNVTSNDIITWVWTGVDYRGTWNHVIQADYNPLSNYYNLTDLIARLDFAGLAPGEYTYKIEGISGGQYFVAYEKDFTVTEAVSSVRVTFDGNGGAGIDSVLSGAPGESMQIPIMIPQRFGYNFLGWSTDPNAAVESYWPGEYVSVACDTVLYAIWAPATVINPNLTAENHSVSIRFPYDYHIYSFTPSIDACYRFQDLGSSDSIFWLLDENNQSIESSDDANQTLQADLWYYLDPGTTYYIRVNLYNESTGEIRPQFRRVYEIGYHADGADPASVPEGDWVCAGDAYQISSTVPVRDGYSFLGWSAQRNATSATYRPGQQISVRDDMLLFAVWQKADENPFTDVPVGSFYYDPVLWAVENGITNGTSATTFGPDNQCMRAHVVTFLHRAAGSPVPGSSRNPFTDVKTSDFFYAPVLWAVEKGITNGVSATSFGSYDVCNRAAVVTFLWRAAGSPEPESTSHPFTDVKPTDFYYKPVLWAVENGITNGVDATHFGPGSPCNRAQVVTFLYRAYN